MTVHQPGRGKVGLPQLSRCPICLIHAVPLSHQQIRGQLGTFQACQADLSGYLAHMECEVSEAEALLLQRAPDLSARSRRALLCHASEVCAETAGAHEQDDSFLLPGRSLGPLASARPASARAASLLPWQSQAGQGPADVAGSRTRRMPRRAFQRPVSASVGACPGGLETLQRSGGLPDLRQRSPYQSPAKPLRASAMPAASRARPKAAAQVAAAAGAFVTAAPAGQAPGAESSCGAATPPLLPGWSPLRGEAAEPSESDDQRSGASGVPSRCCAGGPAQAASANASRQTCPEGDPERTLWAAAGAEQRLMEGGGVLADSELGWGPGSASSSPASTVSLRLSGFNPVASRALAGAAGDVSAAPRPSSASDSDTVLLASPVRGEPHSRALPDSCKLPQVFSLRGGPAKPWMWSCWQGFRAPNQPLACAPKDRRPILHDNLPARHARF